MKYEPLKRKYHFFYFGLGWAIVSYAQYTGPIMNNEIMYMMSVIVGLLLAFVQIDRNVYRERLQNLQDRITEENINVERKEYTDYEIK